MDRRVLVASLAVLAGCRPSAPRARYVTEWIGIPYEAARIAGRSTGEGTRASAYVSIAMYEAYGAEQGTRLKSLAGQVNGLWNVPAAPAGGVDGATAAAEAARTILDSMFAGFTAADSVAAAQALSRGRENVNEATRSRSVEHGRVIARAILAWSQSDGFASMRRRAELAKPPKVVTAADWGALRTFALRNGDECASPPAPAYSTKPTSDFWKMAKSLYDSTRSVTPEAATLARRWGEDSSQSDAAAWTGMLSKVASSRSAPASEVAEAWMLASVALADADIAARRQQAREALVPPAAYIKKAIDPGWTPIQPMGETSYPSGPAVVASTAAEVLAHGFGDTATVRDSVESAGASRTKGFGQVRDEILVAGVTLGSRYPLAAERGREQGKCIAGRVLGRLGK